MGLSRGQALYSWWYCVILPKPRAAISFLFACALLCTNLGRPAHAQESAGNIVGHVHILRGDAPPQRILVSLKLRGAEMDSVYTDSQGTFGFHNLPGNLYYVDINDEHYEQVHQEAVISSSVLSPTLFLDISLEPKRSAQAATATQASPSGANPGMADVREYLSHFPKQATKEFEKGVQADKSGQTDNAVKHYTKAIQISPDLYYAHNNLGSDYLSQSKFAPARAEFEKVIELNQSDAAGYFNLGNVCMLMGQMSDAQRSLDEGIRRQPDSALGQFLMGSLNLRLGKLAEAERDLRRAIQLSPEMTQPRLQLVNLYLQQGRKQDAATALRAFVDAFPDNGFSPKARQLLQQLDGQAKAATSRPQ